jgi:hypothetical protein
MISIGVAAPSSIALPIKDCYKHCLYHWQLSNCLRSVNPRVIRKIILLGDLGTKQKAAKEFKLRQHAN